MSYIYLPNGRLVPGSSTTMLSEMFLRTCKRSYEQYDDYAQVSPLHLSLSLSYIPSFSHKSMTVTLVLFYDDCNARRPEYNDFVIAPSHGNLNNSVYGDSPNGLKGLRTYGMIDANISCQNGLHSIFETILEKVPNGKYQSITVDPGIYWRAYRVSYQ